MRAAPLQQMSVDVSDACQSAISASAAQHKNSCVSFPFCGRWLPDVQEVASRSAKGGLPTCKRWPPAESGLSSRQSSFTNSSKRNSVSVGPEAASGWNWAENQGLRLWRMPSLEPSFILMKRGSQSAPRVLLSTA